MTSTFNIRTLAVALGHLALLAALQCQFCFGAHRASLPGEWPTFGKGPAHTGYFPGTVNGLPFVLKWSAPVGSFSVSQAAVGGGRAFVSVGYYYRPESLQVFDAITGKSLWTNIFAGAFSVNPPTYDAGSVYVQRSDGGSSGSQLWSFNAVTGQTNWAAPFVSQGYLYMAPVVADGTVYADTGRYSELTAYNRTNGAQKFSVSTLGTVGCNEWTPAYYNGKVYTWVNGYFAEHSTQTGLTNWALRLGNESEFLYSMKRTMAIADGRAYFTSTTNLFAVDLAQRQTAWRMAGRFSDTPAVANGVVYAISNGVVSAFTTNGAYVGTYRGTNGSSFSGQLIVTDDVLIVAGSYGTYMFDLADFSVRQYITSFHTNCYCYYASSISMADNILYISSGNSNLLAYSAEDLWRLTINGNGGTFGTPSPHYYGTNYVLTNALVTESVPSPISSGVGTRRLVTGWTGSGSVAASGSTNRVTFVATNDSTLTWNWLTEYWLDVTVVSSGALDVADSWRAAGETVTISATPSNYYHFAQWSGDVSGTSNVIQVAMTAPRNVRATFEANVVTNAVPEWWLAQYGLPVSDAGALVDTDGDSMFNWEEFRAGTNPLDARSVLRMGVIGPTAFSSQVRLLWPSATGRRYRLWGTTNLGTTAFAPVASNIFANPPMNSFFRTPVIGETWFYFVEVQ